MLTPKQLRARQLADIEAAHTRRRLGGEASVKQYAANMAAIAAVTERLKPTPRPAANPHHQFFNNYAAAQAALLEPIGRDLKA